MTQFYFNPSRESDSFALPDAEVFYHDAENPYGEFSTATDEGIMPSGWYYWACFPGCVPDGDPVGPFETEAEAIADAQDFHYDDSLDNSED